MVSPIPRLPGHSIPFSSSQRVPWFLFFETTLLLSLAFLSKTWLQTDVLPMGTPLGALAMRIAREMWACDSRNQRGQSNGFLLLPKNSYSKYLGVCFTCFSWHRPFDLGDSGPHSPSHLGLKALDIFSSICILGCPQQTTTNEGTAHERNLCFLSPKVRSPKAMCQRSMLSLRATGESPVLPTPILGFVSDLCCIDVV